MRAENMTIEACRHLILRAVIGQNGDTSLPSIEKLPTMARYLCMRVEQQVIAQEASL